MDTTAHGPSQDEPLRLERPNGLVLYVSADRPTDADRQAEAAVRAFDPSIPVKRIEHSPDVYPTPRLKYNRGAFGGVRSILAFIEQTCVEEHSAGLSI